MKYRKYLLILAKSFPIWIIILFSLGFAPNHTAAVSTQVIGQAAPFQYIGPPPDPFSLEGQELLKKISQVFHPRSTEEFFSLPPPLAGNKINAEKNSRLLSWNRIARAVNLGLGKIAKALQAQPTAGNYRRGAEHLAQVSYAASNVFTSDLIGAIGEISSKLGANAGAALENVLANARDKNYHAVSKQSASGASAEKFQPAASNANAINTLRAKLGNAIEKVRPAAPAKNSRQTGNTVTTNKDSGTSAGSGIAPSQAGQNLPPARPVPINLSENAINNRFQNFEQQLSKIRELITRQSDSSTQGTSKIVTTAVNNITVTNAGASLSEDNSWTGAQTFLSASTTLQDFTFRNATGTDATTTNLYVSGRAYIPDLQADTATIGALTVTTCSGCGGGSGGGTWSTTTSQVTGRLVNHPNNNTDIVAVGAAATTSASVYFDTNTSAAKIFNQYFALSSTTLQNFTFVNATGTKATSTNFFSTIASSTNLFATAANIGTLTLDALSSALPVSSGGTGAATLTGLLQGNGTSAFTAITNSSTAGQVLRVTGASTYAWGALDLADTDAITGDLPFANLTQLAANTVLANPTGSTADAQAVSTSTLFGASVPAGRVLMSTGSGWTAAATSTCVQITGSADLCDGSDATGGGGGTFAWTTRSYGNSTSTTLGFLNGFLSTASSTINANLIITGNSTTTNATSTSFFATTASTTNFSVGNSLTLFGTTGTSLSSFCTAITGSADLCDGSDATGGGGGTFAWTVRSYGVSTSTTLGFLNGFLSTASSTIDGNLIVTGNSTTTQATTTKFAISSIASSLLKTSADGSVIPAVAGTDFENIITAGNGLTRTVNNIDCDTASVSVFGCLLSTDWALFNNKVSTTSIDTIGEVETLWGVTNIITQSDIDTSSELLSLFTDETGTGNIVFNTLPSLAGFISTASSTVIGNLNITGNSTSTNATTTNLYVSNNLDVGATSGTGDSVFQFANDTDSWVMGYYSTDKTFRIASSTNLSANVYFQIGKSGTTTLNSAIASVVGTDQSLCIDATTFEITRQAGDSCAASAARYKHDIAPFSFGALEMVGKFNPVSFMYNNDPENIIHWGFIADEMASTSPELAYFNPDGSVQTINNTAITAVLAKAIQELNNTLFERIGIWFADATNGITDFFANRVRTKEICLSDSSGAETCITKAQLDALLAGAASNGGTITIISPAPVPGPEPVATTTEVVTEPAPDSTASTSSSQVESVPEPPLESEPEIIVGP